MMIPAGVLLVATAGCAPVDPGFGEAVRYDMAAQTVDPDPQYPADAAKPGDNGEHAQKATERYRKGQTKSLRELRTGGGGGGGGNGGGGSGAGGGSTPGS
jgi:uncharacterized membrane protein YgcG